MNTKELLKDRTDLGQRLSKIDCSKKSGLLDMAYFGQYLGDVIAVEVMKNKLSPEDSRLSPADLAGAMSHVKTLQEGAKNIVFGYKIVDGNVPGAENIYKLLHSKFSESFVHDEL